MQQVPPLRQPGAQEGAGHLVQVLVEYQEQLQVPQGQPGLGQDQQEQQVPPWRQPGAQEGAGHLVQVLVEQQEQLQAPQGQPG